MSVDGSMGFRIHESLYSSIGRVFIHILRLGDIMRIDDYGRDTVADIDLDAIAHNVSQVRDSLPMAGQLMAVVKADAYGHGAIPVARVALAAGARRLAVAMVDEARELRGAGVSAPIHVLGVVPSRSLPYAIRARLVLTVTSMLHLRAMREISDAEKKSLEVHLKVDTGVGRLGLDPDEVLAAVRFCEGSRWLRLQGIMTHFATADEEDPAYLKGQVELFSRVIEGLESVGVHVPWVYASNTAGVLRREWVPFRQMVRLGIGMYGICPAPFLQKEGWEWRPALTLRSKVTTVRKLRLGSSVGYGRAYVARGDEWVATVPIGYADGIRRDVGQNGGYVLIKGRPAPILGVVSMDQLTVNVVDLLPVSPGEEVVVYGRQGDAEIRVEDVARRLGTISYELLCAVGRRVPRQYLQAGKVVARANFLSSLGDGDCGDPCF